LLRWSAFQTDGIVARKKPPDYREPSNVYMRTEAVDNPIKYSYSTTKHQRPTRISRCFRWCLWSKRSLRTFLFIGSWKDYKHKFSCWEEKFL